MRRKRRKTNSGVVAPVRTTVSLPPCAANRVGAHAEPHTELEDTRKGAGRGQTDHQRLNDSEFRLRLHDPRKPQHRRRRHDAIGIERNGDVMRRAPALAEVLDITGLEAGIVAAPPVGDRNAALPCRRKFGKARVFLGRDGRKAGVTQHVKMKLRGCAGLLQAIQHDRQIAQHARRRLVADAH